MRKPILSLPLGLAVLGLAACAKPTADVPASPETPSPPVTDGADAGAAGAAQPAAGSTGTSQAWNCDGKQVTATYDNAKREVSLQFGAEVLILPEAVSGSGARYADAAGNVFWEHQGASTLSLAGGKSLPCTKAGTTGG